MAGPRITKAEAAARREDLQWLVETGEHLTGACHRLGITRDTLYAWCHSNGCLTLYQRLASRDPNLQDHHVTTKRWSTAA